MPSLITRQDASDLGLIRFYTGQPCARGHDSERLANSNACITCMNLNKQARSKTKAFKDQRNARLMSQRAERRELRPCIICQTPFDIMVDGRLSAKACSIECSAALRDKRTAEKRKTPDRECAWCFGEFASRKSAQMCCSPTCGIAFRDERRAMRKKVCIHCKGEFVLGPRDGRNGFCSDECRDAKHTERVAKYHQRLRIFKPEVLKAQRDRYKLINAEAHGRTVKMINDRRIAHEVAALTVAKDVIPDMLATVRGYRNKVNMAIEFMRSLDINVPKHATEPTP